MRPRPSSSGLRCPACWCSASCMLPPMSCCRATSTSSLYTCVAECWLTYVTDLLLNKSCAEVPFSNNVAPTVQVCASQRASPRTPLNSAGLARVGDPSKELSGEFSLMLNKSLAPASGNYPIRRDSHWHPVPKPCRAHGPTRSPAPGLCSVQPPTPCGTAAA